jgi:predicted acetyltransferase
MYRWLRGDWQAVLIVTGSVVVGYALYHIQRDEYHPQQTEVYLRQYFVRQKFRGQGVGAAAFEKLVTEMLATNGIHRICGKFTEGAVNNHGSYLAGAD